MALPNSDPQTIEALTEVAKLTSLANRFSFLRKASDSKLEKKVLNKFKS